jgi:hypothetical protein
MNGKQKSAVYRLLVMTLISVAFHSTEEVFSAPISFTLRGTVSTTGSSPLPEAVLKLQTGPTGSGSVATFMELDPPDPGNIDGLIHFDPLAPPVAVWTIDEQNAASFGLDWNAFEAGLGIPNREMRLVFSTSNSGTNIQKSIIQAVEESGVDAPDNAFVRNVSLQEIRITLDYYYRHPLITSLRAVKFGVEMDGTGEVVPEPSVWLLGAASCLGCFGLRRRVRALIDRSS